MSVFDYKNQPSVLLKDMIKESNKRQGKSGWMKQGGYFPGLSDKSDARQAQRKLEKKGEK